MAAPKERKERKKHGNEDEGRKTQRKRRQPSEKCAQHGSDLVCNMFLVATNTTTQ